MKAVILIPHYEKAEKDREKLIRCVNSILDHYPRMAIDSDVEVPQAPDTTDVYKVFIRTNSTGFTANVNRLIRLVRSLKWEWAFILNNDTTIESNILEELDRAFCEHPEAGIVAPQQVLMSDPNTIFFGGCGQLLYGLHKGGIRGQHCTKPEWLIWATFAAVAIRREVFDDIGLLDPALRFIFSDSDFCLRARHFGWRILYWPYAVVRHEVGQSFDPKEKWVQRMMVEDRLQFERKWLNGALFHDLNSEVFDAVL